MELPSAPTVASPAPLSATRSLRTKLSRVEGPEGEGGASSEKVCNAEVQDAPFRRKEGGKFCRREAAERRTQRKVRKAKQKGKSGAGGQKNVFSDDIQRSSGDCQSVFAALYRLESIKRCPVADHQVSRRRHSQDGQRSGSGESRSLVAPTRFSPDAVNVLCLVCFFFF